MTLLLALLLLGPASRSPAQQVRHPTPHHAVRHPARRRPLPRRRVRRPAGIRPSRALQIQHALMAAGYLDRASGYWDAATRLALLRYQRAHHWQTRFIPDARALIALGLGPAPPVMAAAANHPR
jgi:hypothetical protein